MRLTTFIALSTLATAGLLGCRSDSKTTDGNTGDTGGSGGAVKIQDVQNDTMPPGTPVTLHGVVVTAIDNFGGKMGDIWVEEPEGGTYSGVHVFGAASTDVAALAVGDLVDITGAVKDEFALTGSNADPSGRTVTELKPAAAGSLSVKKTGTGTVPAPVVVDALAIGMMSDADTQGPMFTAAWEPYEGVLVSVANVDALGAPKAFGSTMAADAYSFNITGVAKVEGNMTDITMSGIKRNTCMSLTGVVDYFYDYLVLPRSASDLDTTATGCPVPEAACGDSIDNDGNGFADCKDNNCIINDGTCHSATTIAALDQAADANPASPTLPAGGVQISGACVTAIPTSTTPSSAYIAASGTAANDGGIFAFGGGQPLPTGLAVGDKVDVIGTVSAFKSSGSTAPEGQLEIAALQVTKVTGTCGVPVPHPSSTEMSTFATDAGSHPLIGSVVTLTP
ncbi:MAG: hypothetical protein JO257_07620, partial [Deltaproteobacteria bacterium]|nr:hypothetical protein [Deltaproteobacteria bacterium]